MIMNFKTFSTAIAVTSFFAFNSANAADNFGGTNVTIFGGMGYTAHDVQVDPGRQFTSDRTGIDGGAKISYGELDEDFYIGGDLGVTFSAADPHTSRHNTFDFKATRANTVELNVRPGLVLDETVMVYGLAGVNVQQSQYTVKAPNVAEKSDQYETTIGFNLGLGTEIVINNGLNLRLENVFRYNDGYDINHSAAGIKYEIENTTSNTTSAGLVLKF